LVNLSILKDKPSVGLWFKSRISDF